MRRVLWASLIAIIFAGSGCGGEGNSIVNNPGSLTLSPEMANLVRGKTLTLSVIRNGKKIKSVGFTWQSSDPGVATVDRSGVVTGVKVGVVTITATSKSASGMATVGVVSPNPGAAKLSLSGTAFYEDQPFDQNGFTGTTTKPIRNTVVEAVAIDGFTSIGTGSTDHLGNIVMQDVDNSTRRGGVYLRVLSKTVDGHDTKIEVKNNSTDKLSLSSASSDAVDDSQASSGVLNITARKSGIGGAFNILDALSDASEFVQGQSGCPQPNPTCIPPLLTAYWEPESAEGTFFDGQSAITILGGGGPGGDADEYDDSVIIHEYGHFILSKFSHDDSLGGLHGLTENDQDIRLSWSEGWANFFSSAVRNTSTYVDTIPGGVLLSFDLENYSSIQTTTLNASAIYTTSEVAVAGVLWDIFDTPVPDDDGLSLGFSPVWKALLQITPDSPGIPAKRATVETFWLEFEAAQSTLEITALQTVLAERKIELKIDPSEISGETALSSLGGSQHHTLYLSSADPAGDIDIIPLTFLPNTTYTVKTFGLTNGADTFLEIKSGGTSVISNDNPGNTFFSTCTINPFGVSNCPKNGQTNLSSSVTFNSGLHPSLSAHVSRSSVAPPSAGLFGAYDMTLTSP